MKKLFLAIATVALLFATSCKKDVNAPENIQLGENEFLATIDNGAVPQNAPAVRDGMNTMTTIDGNRCVFWSEGDVISINGNTYTAGESGNTVIFTGEGAENAPYHAFYPASIASIEGDGNRGILPPVQIYNGANNVSNLPMYACSTTKELTFHNICAVLKIVVPEYFAGATKIEVSSDQRMNGEFYVGDDNKLSMYWFDTPDNDDQKKITIRKPNDAAFTEGEEVYIAVPAGDYSNFTVAAINGDGAVLWDKTLDECELEVNKIYPVNITYDGLCFTAAAPNCTVAFNNIPTLDGGAAVIKYSTDGTNWGNYTGPITLVSEGDRVYFCASTDHNTAFSGASFEFTGDVKASGNIMSLYGPDCPNIQLPDNAFYGLFQNCNNLQTAPKLPATKLATNCYANMFMGCVSLQTAPKLPATELATNCYANMFMGCGSLQKAPKLPATELAEGCYQGMFSNCGSLQKAPELPATELAVNCYQYMFDGCGSLQKAPELPATTLVGYCYANMFQGCSSLNEVWIYAENGFDTEDYCLSDWLSNAGNGSGTIHCKQSEGDAVKTAIENASSEGWTVSADLP